MRALIPEEGPGMGGREGPRCEVYLNITLVVAKGVVPTAPHPQASQLSPCVYVCIHIHAHIHTYIHVHTPHTHASLMLFIVLLLFNLFGVFGFVFCEQSEVLTCFSPSG